MIVWYIVKSLAVRFVDLRVTPKAIGKLKVEDHA
ncbi:MAG: hypothetical protein ACJARY_001671 [Candidatus Azotimanducaceae bacterium]|jgi:hypothetical protein